MNISNLPIPMQAELIVRTLFSTLGVDHRTKHAIRSFVAANGETIYLDVFVAILDSIKRIGTLCVSRDMHGHHRGEMNWTGGLGSPDEARALGVALINLAAMQDRLTTDVQMLATAKFGGDLKIAVDKILNGTDDED